VKQFLPSRALRRAFLIFAGAHAPIASKPHIVGA
jgi:hypothetical protein